MNRRSFIARGLAAIAAGAATLKLFPQRPPTKPGDLVKVAEAASPAPTPGRPIALVGGPAHGATYGEVRGDVLVYPMIRGDDVYYQPWVSRDGHGLRCYQVDADGTKREVWACRFPV